jgi:NAD(P)-dependent dehydrogenase (short-subunit alcohol dehydrogenase family)
MARAALKAGQRVAASARRRSALTAALGPDSEQLLALELDVTHEPQAQAAVAAAVERFAGIDVLVNNAGFGHYGFFEESTPDEARAQFETNLFGVFNLTWAALPAMRAARRGWIFNISSLGGILGGPMASLYCATKFALEGFSESLAKEVAPFGVSVTIVEPGPFRTQFLAPASLRLTQKTLADYDARRQEILGGIEQRNGRQPGDPHRLAQALLLLANEPQPPLRFLAGSIAVGAAEDKLAAMRAELSHWRPLSLSTDGDFRDSNVGDLQKLIR